jgi:hypothetical protein
MIRAALIFLLLGNVMGLFDTLANAGAIQKGMEQARKRSAEADLEKYKADDLRSTLLASKALGNLPTPQVKAAAPWLNPDTGQMVQQPSTPAPGTPQSFMEGNQFSYPKLLAYLKSTNPGADPTVLKDAAQEYYSTYISPQLTADAKMRLEGMRDQAAMDRAQLGADTRIKTTEMRDDTSRGNAELGANTRVKTTDMRDQALKESTETTAKSRIEAAKIRASSGGASPEKDPQFKTLDIKIKNLSKEISDIMPYAGAPEYAPRLDKLITQREQLYKQLDARANELSSASGKGDVSSEASTPPPPPPPSAGTGPSPEEKQSIGNALTAIKAGKVTPEQAAEKLKAAGYNYDAQFLKEQARM